MLSFQKMLVWFVATSYFWEWLLVTVVLAVFAAWCIRKLKTQRGPGTSSRAGALLALGIVFMVLNGRALPTGDEPHYLIMAQSLLDDGDFDLRNNYEQRDYLAYYPMTIPDPHVTIVGEKWYPVHGLGLPILIAPAFAVGGRPAVVGLLSLITVAGLGLLWSVLRSTGFQIQAASVATLVAGFTLPVVSMSGQIFPEVIAFLLVAFVLRAALRPELTTWDHLGILFGMAILPWLHAKYAVLAVGLLVAVAVMRGLRKPARLLAAATVVLGASIIALAVLSDRWFGVPLPGVPIMMGKGPFTGDMLTPIAGHFLVEPWVGLAGVLFDQQSGLLFASPVYALVIPGMLLLWRRRRAWVIGSGLVVASLYLPAGAFGVWYGGFSSPARLLTPVIPVLSLGVATVLEEGGSRRWKLFLLLAVPSFLYAYMITALPSFTRYGDPVTQHSYFIGLVERMAHLNLTPLFPSFRNVSPITWLTTAVYLLVIVGVSKSLVRKRYESLSA
jgi:hypothetical protein